MISNLKYFKSQIEKRRKHGTRRTSIYMDDCVVALRRNVELNFRERGCYVLTDVDADAGFGHNLWT